MQSPSEVGNGLQAVGLLPHGLVRRMRFLEPDVPEPTDARPQESPAALRFKRARETATRAMASADLATGTYLIGDQGDAGQDSRAVRARVAELQAQLTVDVRAAAREEEESEEEDASGGAAGEEEEAHA